MYLIFRPLFTMLASTVTSKSKPTKPYFADYDCRLWRRFSGLTCEDKIPRVLMFTWGTEDTFITFQNENYWKACYAHMHGFDLVFTSQGSDPSREWYSDENMYAWVHAIKPYVNSGSYDIIFVTGSDTLIMDRHLPFPVWAWYHNHFLTIMDNPGTNPGGDFQDPHFSWSFGFNENSELYAPVRWRQRLDDFLNRLIAHQGHFLLMGLNGAYMEAILETLGHEAVGKGRPGYNSGCLPLALLNQSAATYFREKKSLYFYNLRNRLYSRCFFKELARLVGPFGKRVSEYIGFVKLSGPVPWSNCHTELRHAYGEWPARCFAVHFNGPKVQLKHKQIRWSCPDASFNWSLSPYNPRNRACNLHKTVNFPAFVDNELVLTD